MPLFPDTRESLIASVRDVSNREAWHEFEEIYRPVIFRIARTHGMQHSDAHDIVQQVLMSVAAAIERFEQRADGTPFRHWLSRVTRNAILKSLQRRPRDRGVGGSDVLDLLSDIPSAAPSTEALIEFEYRREIYARAARAVQKEVREHTWLAFELTALQQHSIEDAAKTLGLSTGSVYAARSRIMRRLRDTVADLTGPESEENKHASD